jgi:hypothetical protein
MSVPSAAYGFLSDNELQAEMVGPLKAAGISDFQPGGASAWWSGIISAANRRAWGTIRRKLLARGYSLAQVLAWDDGWELQRALGIYQALSEGIRSDEDQKVDLTPFDREGELDVMPISIGGVAQSVLAGQGVVA